MSTFCIGQNELIQHNYSGSGRLSETNIIESEKSLRRQSKPI